MQEWVTLRYKVRGPLSGYLSNAMVRGGKRMRLRRVEPYSPGFRRVRRGRGFSYVHPDGSRVTDEEALERIHHLVIPPAWQKVWICERSNGHIQAVGIDAAGRRQYLYHEQWRLERDEEKFDRVLEFAQALPDLRAHLTVELSESGLSRHRVEAVAIRLLDRGLFRVGSEQYAEENDTHGVATLLRSHVHLSGDQLTFDYNAKGGIRRQVSITDAALAKAIRALRRSDAESERLLVYRDGERFRELHADDINLRMRELIRCDCSAKDFRTWHATVLASAAFARHDLPSSERAIKKVEKEVMEEVSSMLGNTPTIARTSYVDPRIVRGYRQGRTIERALNRASRSRSESDQQAIIEKAVVSLLRRMAR
jgi:DNA topoisomerase-1